MEHLQTVTLPNKEIYLLGTAHISDKSVKEVINAITTLKPDLVAVELDELRLQKLLKENDALMNLDLFKIIKQGKGLMLLASIVLSSFQRRLGDNLDVPPGSEMLAAINTCKEQEIEYQLVDRSAEVTLKRAWGKSSFWGKQKIIVTLFATIFSKDKISEEDLTELKQKSAQGQMMEELSRFLPELKKVFVDERDEFISVNLIQCESKKILGIFGAAHVSGIIAKLQAYSKDPIEIPSNHLEHLQKIPKKKKFPVFRFVVPLAIIGLFVLGFIRGGTDRGIQNVVTWWLVNGGLSFLGALLALAHPVTMVLSFLAAPLTSINPFVGVGLVTGLSETFFRMPKGKDIASLQSMSLSIKNLYKNRVTRILIVFFLTTLGSAIGTFIGISMLATQV